MPRAGENLIGEEGRGFYLATAGLGRRAPTAARRSGWRRRRDDAVACRRAASVRQADQTFQAIRFKIAGMATEIGRRALSYAV